MRSRLLSLLALAFLLSLSAPAEAALTLPPDDDATLCSGGSIAPGSDFWQTPSTGTHVTVPAGFFCPGSSAVQVSLRGVPVLSSPSLGQTDTVVRRLDAACFDSTGVASGVHVRVEALSLVGSVSAASVGCAGNSWSVKANRRAPAAGEVDVTTVDVVREGTYGGTFSGTLAVPTRVVFSRPGQADLVLDVHVEFATSSVWATQPGEGGVIVPGPVRVDTDGDGDLSDETLVPGNNTGFHPGWSGVVTWPPVPVVVEHDGIDESHLTVAVPISTCSPSVVDAIAKVAPGSLATSDVGVTTVVALDVAVNVGSKSLDVQTPCSYADAATTYVVGVRR
jgi:hypothetical protein